MHRRRILLLTAVAVALVAIACRTAPPPGAEKSAPGVVAKREGGAEDIAGKIVLDEACSDFANTQNQIVCVTNKGEAKVDISEWLIRNALGRTYYFPPGTSIDPGKSIKVHTGAGTNDAQNLYWNYEFKPVFDKKEQVVLVSTSNIDISKLVTP
ncbi:MAG: lamin tail domain-containing protein [Chloroflexi bacterium]|nr:lamin tail domain-containing protein [Chloroflexota bacterium]